MATRPSLFIFTGGDHLTGALIAACNEACLLEPEIAVTIILSHRSKLTSKQLPGTPTIQHLPLAQIDRKLIGFLLYPAALIRSAWALRQALRKGNCARLQVNDFHFAEGAIARLFGYRGRIATWIRIDPQRYGLVGRAWLTLARWTSNEIVAVSRHIQDRLPADFPSSLIYDPAPAIAALAPVKGQRLLFIGNYIEGKGQDAAILAFHRIARRFPSAELVFHGSEMGLSKNRDYRARLTAMAAVGDGRDRIHLLDFVEEPGIAYRLAFAALNFSLSESFSFTCLEASAHGLPVIATRCGGPEEIVEQAVTGFLVRVNDVDAMAFSMSTLLDDPDRAAEMGAAGRRLVTKRFATDRFRHQVTQLFELN